MCEDKKTKRSCSDEADDGDVLAAHPAHPAKRRRVNSGSQAALPTPAPSPPSPIPAPQSSTSQLPPTSPPHSTAMASSASRPRSRPSSTSPPSSSGSVLDFASFPHIRDAVLRASPRASLIALRTTSRRLRDLCDAHLVRHIVFTANGAETPCGRIPSEDWYERPEVARCVAIADLATVPTRPPDVDPDMCLCPGGAHTCGAEALAPFLTNLELVRLNNAGVQADYTILSAPRLSLHLDVVPDTLAGWGTAPGKIVTTACVSGADTVTMLVTYHPEHTLNHFGFYYWLSFPPALKHLVIHYRPRVDLPPAPHTHPVPDPRELERPTLLQTFANSLCRGTHGGLRYSLVGLDQTWPGMYRPPERRDDPTPLSTELFAAARQEGKRLLGWDDEMADSCLARVSFPTLEEYRAEISDDLFAGEMSECF